MENPTPNRAGRRAKQFATEVDLGVSTLYALPAEMQPHSVRIGTARIITEEPRDWLARIGRMQAERAA